MTSFRTLALSVTIAVVIAAKGMSLEAQTAQPTSQPASIIVNIVLENSHVLVGQKPRAIVTIKNIGDQEIPLATDGSPFRVHIEGRDGEPAKTELHRRLLGDYRRGDGPSLAGGGIVLSIRPGASESQTIDLTSFYDFRSPGKYTVYIEFNDESHYRGGSKVWLRSNTARFEIEAPAQ